MTRHPALSPSRTSGALCVKESGGTRRSRDLDALVECAKAGDRRAFRQVAEVLEPPLLRYVTGYLRGDADTARDVVQDTFVAAWKKLDTIRGGSHLRPWLYRVARCKAITWLRRRGPKGTPMDSIERVADLGIHPSAPVETQPGPLPQLQVDDLLRAVEQLPPLYAGVIRLHYFHGYDTRETAHLLGVPRTAVKMRLHRARKRLRALLAEFREERRPDKET